MTASRIGNGTMAYLSTGFDAVVSGNANALVYVQDLSIEDINRTDVEMTAINSTQYREYVSNQPDAGSVAFSVFFSTTDAWAVDRLLDDYFVAPNVSGHLLHMTIPTSAGAAMISGESPPTTAWMLKLRVTNVGLQFTRDDMILQTFRAKITALDSEPASFFSYDKPIAFPTT